MKKWLSFLVGLGISAAIFVALLGSDLTMIWEEIKGGDYIYLIPGAFFFIVGIWTRAIRWRIILNDQIDVKHSFHIINVGYFISGVLPFRIGDVARAWLTTRLDRPVAGFTTLSTIVVERLLDLMAVLGMLGITLLVLDVPSEVSSAGAFIGGVALIGSVVMVIFAQHPHYAHSVLAFAERVFPFLEKMPLTRILEHVLAGIEPISNPKVAFKAMLWTVISWSLSVAAGYSFLYIIFDQPTVQAALAFIVLGAFSVALPAVPGNLGAFEASVVGGLWIGGLISSVSSPENAPAVAFAGIQHGVMLGIYITLGIVGLWYEKASLRQITQGSRALQQNAAQNMPPNSSGTGSASHLVEKIIHEQA